MNVKELREALAGLPDDWPVILQKDAEGNGYSPLDEVEDGMYSADSTWSGEVYPTAEQLAELIKGNVGWSEDDAAPEDAVRALVLSPVN